MLMGSNPGYLLKSSLFYLAAECGPCTHGHCSAPGICTCHPGYTGPTCEDCIPNPDCEYGTCINNPFECVCYDGFEGLFCTTPICKESCHPEHVRTDILLIIEGCSILKQTIWPWNHTSHTKVYFNEFVANALRDNIGIVIFDLRGHGGC